MLNRILITVLIFLFALPLIAQDVEDSEDEQPSQDRITISISMYLLVDDIDNPNPDISTDRTMGELRDILDKMNDIWSQADIELELNYVGYVAVPEAILEDIIEAQFESFFQGVVDGIIDIPDVSQLNGFYAKRIGGPNGVTLNSQIYFVDDNPSVHDERVSSHEVGHMLGLHHDLIDSSHLMYSGTNGITLSEEEIFVTRYFAKGFLSGLRVR